MKYIIKILFAILTVTLGLCACSDNAKSEQPQSNEVTEEKTTEEESNVKYEESAFVKDGILYIRDNDGNCYPYNEGIYTDDETGEDFIYGDYWDLYEVSPEKFSDMDEVSKLEEKNTSGKGVKILLSEVKFDSVADRYYFCEDILGQKLYYPKDGIHEENSKLYVYSKNGTRIYFNSLEEIAE